MSELKLFGKWSLKEIEVNDLGLQKYLSLRPMQLPHSGGRHEHARFGKSKLNIVERLANMFMRPGRAGGKKTRATKIVQHALEIIHLRTRRNPVELLVRAIEQAAPREDVTRLSYGGMVYFKAVDVSPQRRVDLALRYLAESARQSAWKNRKTVEECLADEVILAARGDSRSFAVKKKYELERVAMSSR